MNPQRFHNVTMSNKTMSPLPPHNHENIQIERGNNSEASEQTAHLYSIKTYFLPDLCFQRVLRPIMHIIHCAVQTHLPTRHPQRFEETRQQGSNTRLQWLVDIAASVVLEKRCQHNS
jgi:hypothetical protein